MDKNPGDFIKVFENELKNEIQYSTNIIEDIIRNITINDKDLSDLQDVLVTLTFSNFFTFNFTDNGSSS